MMCCRYYRNEKVLEQTHQYTSVQFTFQSGLLPDTRLPTDRIRERHGVAYVTITRRDGQSGHVHVLGNRSDL